MTENVISKYGLSALNQYTGITLSGSQTAKTQICNMQNYKLNHPGLATKSHVSNVYL